MAQVWRRPASGLALAYAVGPVAPGGHVNVPDGRCGLVWADSTVWWLGPATRPWIPDRALDTVIGIRFSYVTGHGFAGTALGPWRDMRVELSELPSHAAQAAELKLTLAACTSPARQAAVLLGVRIRTCHLCRQCSSPDAGGGVEGRFGVGSRRSTRPLDASGASSVPGCLRHATVHPAQDHPTSPNQRGAGNGGHSDPGFVGGGKWVHRPGASGTGVSRPHTGPAFPCPHPWGCRSV